jgi:hypothetical protein
MIEKLTDRDAEIGRLEARVKELTDLSNLYKSVACPICKCLTVAHDMLSGNNTCLACNHEWQRKSSNPYDRGYSRG